MDLLRFIVDAIQIVLVVAIGLAARAATTGAEHDLLRASHSLPTPLLAIARPAAPIALLVLPVALAVRQIFRRQPRQLAEAVATGILAVVAVAFVDAALRTSSAQLLYDAITMASTGKSHLPPLDPPLAGLAAYTTIIGLSGRPRWRTAVWLTVGTYSLVSLTTSKTTVLALPITLLAGRAIGLGVRYVAGFRAQRPSAAEIALALGQLGRLVTDMRRLPGTDTGSRQYAATMQDGGRFDVSVFDRDQQAAGRWTARWSGARCWPTRLRRPGCWPPGCAPSSAPGLRPPSSPTTTTLAARSRSCSPARPTLSWSAPGIRC